MVQGNAHFLYGNTDSSSCVPDACAFGFGSGFSFGTSASLVCDIDSNLALSASLRRPLHQAFNDALGQYVADVLVVWDCYSKRRMEHTPLLLRFEDFDFLIAADRAGNLSFLQGAVDTSAQIRVAATQAMDVCNESDGFSRRSNSAKYSIESADDERFCPIWISATDFADLAGRRVAHVVQSDDKNMTIQFEKGTLHLKIAREEVVYRFE